MTLFYYGGHMLSAFYMLVITLNISQPMLGELGAVTFGGVAGYSAGFALKKVFKIILIIAGLLFVLFQVLNHYEFISINWMKIQFFFESMVNNEAQVNSFKDILIANLPTGGGFVAGLILGFKKG